MPIRVTASDSILPQVGLPSTWPTADDDSLNGLLVSQLEQGMIDTLNMGAIKWWDWFGKQVMDWSGAGLEWVVDLYPDGSAFVTSGDDGSLLAGSTARPYRALVTSKTMGATVTVTDEMMESVENGGPQELVKTVSYIMNKLQEGFKDRMARAAYRDGTGRVAQITQGTPDGNDDSVDTSQYLRANMPYEVWDSTGATYRGNVYVLRVNQADGTIDYSGASIFDGGTAGSALPAGIVANDYLIWRGAHAGTAFQLQYGRDILGFINHVDDTTDAPTWDGTAFRHEMIDRALHTDWRSHRVDANNASINTDLLHRLIQGIVARAPNEPDFVLWHPFQFIGAAEYLNPNIRVAPGGAAKVGFSDFKFSTLGQEISFQSDRFCPYDEIYALRRADFKMAVKSDLGWRPVVRNKAWKNAAPNAIFAANADRLRNSAALLMMGEFICKSPLNQGKLTNLAVTIPTYGTR